MLEREPSRSRSTSANPSASDPVAVTTEIVLTGIVAKVLSGDGTCAEATEIQYPGLEVLIAFALFRRGALLAGSAGLTCSARGR